jgi:hypothetical protein
MLYMIASFNPLQGAIPRSLLRTQAVFLPFDTL